MKKITAILFLITVFYLGYSQKKNLSIPPGTVKINDNLYFDKQELSNIDYREYSFWVERVFGKNSTEWKFASIDTLFLNQNCAPNDTFRKSNLQRQGVKLCMKKADYLHNHLYNNFPVVDVTYEQATAYCKWRSDRVYEGTLIAKGIITCKLNQNADNYFSIENIFNGKYKIKDTTKLKMILIPFYRLPTIEEWEFAASGGLDLDLFPYGVSNNKVQRNEIGNDTLGLVKVNVSERLIPNKYNLYNIIGNVSEMVSTYGISKGGSWIDDDESCKIKSNKKYEKAEPWLGFRCVCELKNK